MAIPALPNGPKDWQISNTINAILRFINPGLQSSNNDKVLTSTGTDLQWKDAPDSANTTLTTRGDLLTHNASALSRLAIGASGTFLSSDGADPSWKVPTLSFLSNTIAADVSLNNTANYFTGPSVAQGTSGIWLAIGNVTLQDTAGAAIMLGKLWDGTTVVDSFHCIVSASQSVAPSLMGVFSSPAGDIRISVRDQSSTSGKIIKNGSGNGKDSTLTVVRIG